jgi:hypothetical protein
VEERKSQMTGGPNFIEGTRLFHGRLPSLARALRLSGEIRAGLSFRMLSESAVAIGEAKPQEGPLLQAGVMNKVEKWAESGEKLRPSLEIANQGTEPITLSDMHARLRRRHSHTKLGHIQVGRRRN